MRDAKLGGAYLSTTYGAQTGAGTTAATLLQASFSRVSPPVSHRKLFERVVPHERKL